MECSTPTLLKQFTVGFLIATVLLATIVNSAPLEGQNKASQLTSSDSSTLGETVHKLVKRFDFHSFAAGSNVCTPQIECLEDYHCNHKGPGHKCETSQHGCGIRCVKIKKRISTSSKRRRVFRRRKL